MKVEDDRIENTKKYLTKVGKAVMPVIPDDYENQKSIQQPQIEALPKISQTIPKSDFETEIGSKHKIETSYAYLWNFG